MVINRMNFCWIYHTQLILIIARTIPFITLRNLPTTVFLVHTKKHDSSFRLIDFYLLATKMEI